MGEWPAPGPIMQGWRGRGDTPSTARPPDIPTVAWALPGALRLMSHWQCGGRGVVGGEELANFVSLGQGQQLPKIRAGDPWEYTVCGLEGLIGAGKTGAGDNRETGEGKQTETERGGWDQTERR